MSNPLADMVAKSAATNPANAPEKRVRQRIPMALPTLKLAVPEIPGYVLHWFRGNPQRLQQAQQAGYEFVERDELLINSTGLANSYDDDGNTDMGTRVSVASGSEDSESGNRMYLMKIRQEYWDEDQLAVNARQEQTAAQLRGDKGFTEGGMDSSNRYSRGENRNMFQPRKA